MARPRIAIFGTGALGSLLAARLAKTEAAEVTVAGTWPAALDVMRELGVTLLEGENEVAIPVTVIDRGSADRGSIEDVGTFDLAIVAVKSAQTASVARDIAPRLDSGGLVVTLQNGLGNRERLARALGDARVAAGTTAAAATLEGPGRVRFGGDGGTWLAPPASGSIDDPRLRRLESLLGQAGFDVALREDADVLLWGKVAVNCAINPLTALAGVPNGDLLVSRQRRDLVAAIAAEVATVAKAKGIHLLEDPAERALAVARATARNTSSMLQDVRAGRPTEIEALSGAVVREAEGLGLTAPLNRALADAIRRFDGARTQDPAAIDRFLRQVAA